MLTEAAKKELFENVDLRALTGQPYNPARRNDGVRVDCPVHGGKGDLAIFPDHSYCFSAKCGWRGGVYDTAAILLGLYSRDAMWASKHFARIIKKLQELRDGHSVAPVVDERPAPTRAQMERWVALAESNVGDDFGTYLYRWRGFRVDYRRHHLGIYKDALSIPVYDSRGVLQTIRYRRLPERDEEPRYWGVRGHNDTPLLYGLSTLPRRAWAGPSFIMLVEGEWDVLAAQHAGIPATSFINGAGWKRGREVQLERLFERFDYVLTAYDQDEAGQNAITGYVNERGNYVEGFDDAVTELGLRDRWANVTWDRTLGKDVNELVKLSLFRLRSITRSSLLALSKGQTSR